MDWISRLSWSAQAVPSLLLLAVLLISHPKEFLIQRNRGMTGVLRLLEVFQILGLHDKAHNGRKERKLLIIASGRLQVFVHIKRRTLERNIFFPLVKREILEETAFPKEVRHQYVKTYIVQGTVLRDTRFSVTLKISCRM